MTTSNVLIIYTGGTIGMKNTNRGYAPAPGFIGQQLKEMVTFHDPTQPLYTMPPSRFGKRVHYDIIEYDPLLDSSNMGDRDWARIALDIKKYYDSYDGFVVLHGTDTMAFTTSALSFMLENLTKTVVVTGSQIPLSELRNDAVDNLLSSLTVAGHFQIPEVLLCFRGKCLRGNRAWKMDASGLDGFESPNHRPIVDVGIEIDVHWDDVQIPQDVEFSVFTDMCDKVTCCRLFPGIPASMLTNIMSPPVRGCVLETYGAGNAPDTRPEFLEALKEASDRGVVIVNVTQCSKGTVAAHYAAGVALKEVGVVAGVDMTMEAALVKMMYLLGKDYPIETTRELLGTNMRGELTSVSGGTRFTFHEQGFVSAVARVIAEKRGAGEFEVIRHGVQDALFPVMMCSLAAQNDVSGLARLLRNGAGVDDGDYDGRTPLHIAAASGTLEAIKFLIERGADVNKTDRWGNTPLYDALSSGHIEAIAFLKESRAVLMDKNWGADMCTAAHQGDLKTIQNLLSGGIDANVSDYDGRTALHLAACAGHEDVIRALLAAGADKSRTDRFGRTPLAEAKQNDSASLVKLLTA